MAKSLIVAIVLAVVLSIGINAIQQMNRPDCGCGNNICRDVKNNTAIPNEAGCEHFFVCIDGYPRPNSCPPGQWFNPDISQCDNSPNTCDFNFECPDDGLHFLPHEDYCHKYIVCFNGYPILSRCAEGLYWDRKLESCNFKEYSECKLEVCPTEPAPGDIKFIPSDQYCDKFYLCSTCINDNPKEFWCAEGLHFNQELGQCDFPDNVNCTIEDAPEPGRPKPHSIDCGEGLYFAPHPNSCEHYFICVDTESHMFDCAPGLWFDPVNQWCDNPENVQCEAAPPSDESKESDESNESKESDESKESKESDQSVESDESKESDEGDEGALPPPGEDGAVPIVPIPPSPPGDDPSVPIVPIPPAPPGDDPSVPIVPIPSAPPVDDGGLPPPGHSPLQEP